MDSENRADLETRQTWLGDLVIPPASYEHAGQHLTSEPHLFRNYVYKAPGRVPGRLYFIFNNHGHNHLQLSQKAKGTQHLNSENQTKLLPIAS